MVKKSLITITLLTTLNASWISDNMMESSTDTGFYKTQTRGLYTLGSKKIKFTNQNNITPVHFEPPRMNIGCSGIDTTFGGFSYLNPEYIIEKLKAISSAAPAFAYQMAISTLCKDCSNTMNELEKIADMVNGLNFDTCKATQMGMTYGKKLGEGMNQYMSSGGSDDWIATRVKGARETMQDWKSTFQSSMGKENGEKAINIITMKGSLLNNALTTGEGALSSEELNILGKDDKDDYLLISSIRAMSGDIVGFEGDDGAPRVKAVSQGLKVNYLENLLYGGKIDVVSYKDDKIQALSTKDFEGVKPIFQDKILSVITSMKNKTPITKEQREFLSSLPIPIYKYLNTSVLARTTDADKEILSEYIAILETQELVNYISSLISKSIASYLQANSKDYTREEIEDIKDVSRELDSLSAFADNMTINKLKVWSEKKSLNEHYKKLDQQLKANLANDGIYQSYLWSKGMGY